VSTDQLAVSKRRRRIDRTSEFKDQIVASCLQVGVSVTAIARAHDLNPSLVHRWVRDHERREKIECDEDSRSLESP
jgi:transposase-like protein